MKWNVHLNEDILLEIFGAEITGAAYFSSSVGTFSLRQANYFNEVGRQLLNTDQVHVLTELILEGDLATKEKFLIHNLRKVICIAKRYSHRGLGMFELLSEGINGLIQAMGKFGQESEFRFSAYATKCICRNIERAILNQDNHPEYFQAGA